jgi:peptidoglycan/LPS O-acetylase OafA/YrhL
VVVLGACIIVVAAVHLGSARRLFETGALQRLGGRSFSLYLVHEPIIVSVAQRVDPQHRPLEFVTMSLVLVAAATEVFYRLVERPSITLARRVHARIVASGPAVTPP